MDCGNDLARTTATMRTAAAALVVVFVLFEIPGTRHELSFDLCRVLQLTAV